MLFNIVSFIRSGLCEIIATLFFRFSPDIFLLSHVRSPLFGVSSPAIISTKVDLPDPLSPSIPIIVFFLITKLKFTNIFFDFLLYLKNILVNFISFKNLILLKFLLISILLNFIALFN